MAGGGFLIANAHVDIEANTSKAINNIANLVTKLVAVGPAAGGAATVVAGALGSVTAAVVSAGAATGAFALAAKPQLTAVTDVTKLYADAQKAAAEGASDAAEKQKAYEQALAKLPPATRATAIELSKLKTETKSWSDSLAGSTMPVFTKGISAMRDLLPQLTPLVKTASGAFSDMMDDLKKGVNSGGFKTFMDKLNTAAKETLPDLLEAGKQVFRGIGGIIEAFLPSAGQASGKIADMAKAFGDWGQSLKGSDGFKKFMTFVSENGPKIWEIIKNLAETGKKLFEAFAPFAGIQLTGLMLISEVLSKLPPPVLLGIAAAFVVLKIAMLGFSIASTITGTAMWPLITATWAWTAALLANPVTWIVLGIVALIAVIVLIATKTDWFQKLWSVCWGAIKTAWNATWGALKTGFNAFINFFTTTIPNAATSLKNKVVDKWNELRSKTSEIYNGIKNKVSEIFTNIVNSVKQKVTDVANKVKNGFNSAKDFVSSIGSAIVSKVKTAFTSAYNAVRDKITSMVDKVKSLKSSVTSIFSNAGSWLINAGKNIIKGLINGVSNMIGSLKSKFSSITNMIPDWKGPMDVDLKLLAPSGKALMTGLMDGIGAEVPVLHSQLGGITNSLPNAMGTPASAPTTSGGTVVNLNVEWKSMSMPTPAERRAFAKYLQKEIAESQRDYTKERR